MSRSPAAADPAPTAPPAPRSWRFSRSRTRVAVVLVFGVVAAAITVLTGGRDYAVLIGWDAAAALFACWVWASTVRMDAVTTARHATREDPSRGASDLIILAAAVASLAAVGVVLVEARAASGAREGVLAGLGLFSVAISWLAVHTLFTLRYAVLYYTGPDGGIDFNQTEAPRYTDFAYLAFTLGMTYQVSDTDLKTHAIRATALRHALLSYVFGAVILAATINLLVGLGGSS